MKNKDTKLISKVAALMMFVDQLEAILHPNVIRGLRQAVWDARTEMAQEAKDQVFSREMQALKPVLEEFRNSIQIYSSETSIKMLWHMRPVFKKIIELYGTKK